MYNVCTFSSDQKTILLVMLFSILDQSQTDPSSSPSHQNVANLVLLNTRDSDLF